VSAGLKLPRVMVESAARALCEALGIRLDGGESLLAGSLRRGCDLVGDIDLVCPLPCVGGGGDDALCREILKKFVWVARPSKGTGSLFTPELNGAMGWITEGAHAGFKSCSLVLVRDVVANERSQMRTEIKVQVHRYTPGPMGNRGLIEVIRTGPADFGPAFLALWKRRRGQGVAGAPDALASQHGFLLDPFGAAVPTPTEHSCFELCGIPFIPPERRSVEQLNFHATRTAAGGGGVGGGGWKSGGDGISLSSSAARV
jgi:hypothetical protein